MSVHHPALCDFSSTSKVEYFSRAAMGDFHGGSWIWTALLLAVTLSSKKLKLCFVVGRLVESHDHLPTVRTCRYVRLL